MSDTRLEVKAGDVAKNKVQVIVIELSPERAAELANWIAQAPAAPDAVKNLGRFITAKLT